MALGEAIRHPKNNKRSVATFLLIVPLTLGLISFLFFYISINTILAEKTLPFLRVDNKVTFFSNPEELNKNIAKNLENLNTQEFTFSIDGEDYKIKGSDLALSADTSNAINYGKGSLKNLVSAYTAIISGEEVFIRYDFNEELLTSKFKLAFKSSSANLPKQLQNCPESNADILIDNAKLKSDISNSIRTSIKIKLNSSDYLADSSNKGLVKNCYFYNSTYNQINQLESALGNTSGTFKFVEFSYNDLNPKWNILSKDELSNKLKELKSVIDLAAVDGSYEIHDSTAYLLSDYTLGKALDIDSNIKEITKWLNNPVNEFKFTYSDVNPELLNKNLEILDFTQIMGTGRTRMNMDYDNTIGQSYNAQVGLEEIHNVIVKPGEEFSFFDTIGAHGSINEWTKNNELIATGICTSVTTLFRGVLEAGLPVTLRENHAQYVWKYQWNPSFASDPSSMDLVDATFLALPDNKIDFKFKNDFKHPILIRTKVEYNPQDNFQYHTLEIRSAAGQPKREVWIGNFRILNFVSHVRFDSYFDRTVKENGKTLIEETFMSDYQWGE